MKKILIGIALGFGANRLYKSKLGRNFLRRKTSAAGRYLGDKLVSIWEKNGMTNREFDQLTEALDIIVRRTSNNSKSRLKAV